MIQNFITSIENGSPKLPPMDSEEGNKLQLHYIKEGELKGGYSILEFLPNDEVLVQVYASEDTINKMIESKEYVLSVNIA
jgi:hypothetical protein